MVTDPSTVPCMVTTVSGFVGYADLTLAQAVGHGDPDDAVAVFVDLGGEVACHDVAFSDLSDVSQDRSELRAHGW